MPRIGIGLPGNFAFKSQRKTKTMDDGTKITISSKAYYGTLSGWNINIIDKDGQGKTKFHNGAGLNNRNDINEMMEYTIKNLI